MGKASKIHRLKYYIIYSNNAFLLLEHNATKHKQIIDYQNLIMSNYSPQGSVYLLFEDVKIC